MLERIQILTFLLFFTTLIQAQNVRTYDGTNNNLANPNFGATHSELVTKVSNGFGDFISTPGGTDRPHPRIVSNELFAQNGVFSDPLNMSDFLWVYGQFLDHDITLVGNDPTEDASIAINFNDIHFNPNGAFDVSIPMFRSHAMEGTGTSLVNPRKYTNEITHFIDASGVYGSDQERADYLRSNVNGKMRVSTGNLLPWNTVTGESGAVLDPGAPLMDNENPFNNELFVAGDPRANENPLLAGFHTLFVREHNRLCDEILAANPDWTDEEIYQHARRFVAGFIQNITFEEWLPEMGVYLDDYTGYDPTINPGISNVFSAAAFRLGHTLLNSNIVRVNNDGDTIPEGNLLLRDGFFQPHRIPDEGGLDPLFKGMGIQIQQDLDSKVVDDVRNFLFGPPGAGGLDLASININRGRERGLPDFNTVRGNFGLTPYTTFSEVCSDPAVVAVLTNLYGTVDKLDPWVGMLAEDHMSDALFGETIMKIMEDQFGRLRDGDRFYFENDPGLSEAEKEIIRTTNLHDIIMRNTGITLMQENVFQAMPHDSICSSSSTTSNLVGTILTEDGEQVSNVTVSVFDNDNQPISSGSAVNGAFSVSDLSSCEHIFVGATKEGSITNGVNTLDLILISKHILFIEQLDSPYKIIAADVNNSGSVNVGDLIEIRKAILVISNEFTNNTSWRLVDANYTFNDPTQPLLEDFPELINQGYLSDNSTADFIAIKVADVSGNANPDYHNAVERNYIDEDLVFSLQDQALVKGQTYTIDFKLSHETDVEGFQFTLDYDEDRLAYNGFSKGDLNQLTKDNFGVFENTGLVTASWFGNRKNESESAFSFTFTALENGLLSELIKVNSALTNSEAYNEALDIMGIQLEFENAADQAVGNTNMVLFQNQPNPFTEATSIAFNLPEASDATLTIHDVSGKEISKYSAAFNKGRNNFQLNANELPNLGILYYSLETEFGTETKKMIITK